MSGGEKPGVGLEPHCFSASQVADSDLRKKGHALRVQGGDSNSRSWPFVRVYVLRLSLIQAALQSWGWKLTSSSLLFLTRVLATSYLSRTPLCAPSFLWICYQRLLEPRTLPDTWQVSRQDLGERTNSSSPHSSSFSWTLFSCCACHTLAHTHTHSLNCLVSLCGVCVCTDMYSLWPNVKRLWASVSVVLPVRPLLYRCPWSLSFAELSSPDFL